MLQINQNQTEQLPFPQQGDNNVRQPIKRSNKTDRTMRDRILKTQQ